METWEFLLQREGDVTWHPLASPAQVEIQEGRYRLAVRSSYIDTEVDVRITYESTYEDPPKRRMQKHPRSTNTDGLMIIIPFNYLQPGFWEFYCRPDLITDLMGDTWQHSLQIQVLPSSAIQTEPVTGGAGEQVSVTKETKIEGSLDGENSSNISEAIAPELEPSDPTPSIPATQESPEISQAIAYAGLVAIALDDSTFVVSHDGLLTVSGQVDSTETADRSIPSTELEVYLRDPQSYRIVAAVEQMLPAGSLPVRFTCKLNIPPEVNTRLILGEIALKLAGETPARVLTTESFSVTVDVSALLNAIASNTTNLPNIAPESPPIDSLDTPKEVPTIEFEPSYGVPIPPLLNKSKLKQRPHQPLQLPTLPSQYRPKPKPKPEPVSTEEEEDKAEDTAPAETSVEAIEELSSEINLSEEIDNETTPAETDANPFVPETSSIVHVRKERLFSRLEALATDEELSSWLKAAPNLDPLTIDLDSLFDIRAEPDAHLTAGEFVVDDEPIKPRRHKGERNAKPDFALVPEDEPIPTPKLEVFPSGELTSGQKVRVRVTVAYGLPRLGVKLWIIDRQTRSLLEEPRLLGDFAPNGWGQVEAVCQVTVPFGCLEIRFEAIAQEIQTKRESHKVTVDRTVLPPDLPVLEDEFEF